MWIKFVKDYKILLASMEMKVYREGLTMNCRNEEKARDVISRGFAIAVNAPTV